MSAIDPNSAAALLGDAVLVTGNPHKLAESRRILGFDLAGQEADLPEAQGLDFEAVARAKAEAAWHQLGKPLIVEDTGLALDALNGFPGPLVKWMLDAVGAEGIARTALALDDPRATAFCVLVYRDTERTVLGIGRTPGTLTLPASGDGGFGWDPVFRPDGDARTYGELGAEVKDRIGHRGRAWRDLLSKL